MSQPVRRDLGRSGQNRRSRSSNTASDAPSHRFPRAGRPSSSAISYDSPSAELSVRSVGNSRLRNLDAGPGSAATATASTRTGRSGTARGRTASAARVVWRGRSMLSDGAGAASCAGSTAAIVARACAESRAAQSQRARVARVGRILSTWVGGEAPHRRISRLRASGPGRARNRTKEVKALRSRATAADSPESRGRTLGQVIVRCVR